MTLRAWMVCGIVSVALCGVSDATERISPPGGDVVSVQPASWESDELVAVKSGDLSPHCGCCSSGLRASVDWILWNARRDGLDYASSLNPLWLTPVSVDSMNLERSSGVRVGLGYGFRSGWNVSWNYTYYNTSDSAATNSAVQPGLALISTRSYRDFTVQEVEAQASLNYNVHDIEVGRCIPIDQSMGVRVFGGFRWAMIDQEFDSRYVYRDIGGAFNTGETHNPTNMDAYGVRVGAEGRWQSACGLGVFARGAASVLAGTFETKQEEIDQVDGVILDFSNTSTRAVPILEAAAGVGWTRGSWDASVGYELNSWFNMAQVNRTSYDLLLDGFFARVSFAR